MEFKRRFKVIDKMTGKEADPEEIALNEAWADGLIYCDMEGFAVGEYGRLYLLDECGRHEYAPSDRFEAVWDEADNNVGHKWIPVSEKLPEDDEYVLLYFPSRRQVCGYLRYRLDEPCWCLYAEDGWPMPCNSVPTHWMPLPKPPRVGA